MKKFHDQHEQDQKMRLEYGAKMHQKQLDQDTLKKKYEQQIDENRTLAKEYLEEMEKFESEKSTLSVELNSKIYALDDNHGDESVAENWEEANYENINKFLANNFLSEARKKIEGKMVLKELLYLKNGIRDKNLVKHVDDI